MDDFERQEHSERLRYLETWGMAYMYMYVGSFAIVIIGAVIWLMSKT